MLQPQTAREGCKTTLRSQSGEGVSYQNMILVKTCWTVFYLNYMPISQFSQSVSTLCYLLYSNIYMYARSRPCAYPLFQSVLCNADIGLRVEKIDNSFTSVSFKNQSSSLYSNWPYHLCNLYSYLLKSLQFQMIQWFLKLRICFHFRTILQNSKNTPINCDHLRYNIAVSQKNSLDSNHYLELMLYCNYTFTIDHAKVCKSKHVVN